MSTKQLLLLEDVHGLGRQGDLATAKPGYVRNFLLPQKKVVVADKHTLKMQDKLLEEREKRAAVDRKESEALAAKLVDLCIKTEVKVDPEGKMYGSVSTTDIVHMLKVEGHSISRHNVLLATAIKETGSHKVPLKLKEGVIAFFKLEITPEGGFVAPIVEETPPVESQE